MNMKDLTKEVAYKMRKIRQSLKCSNSQMAAKLGVERSTYNRNEEGRTLPGISTLLKLGNYYDISLDWLLRNKGPMYCKEKIVEKEKEVKIEEPKPDPFAKVLETLGDEAKELLEHMERIPLLRYEVLVLFHKFKEERKEMVERAMKKEE